MHPHLLRVIQKGTQLWYLGQQRANHPEIMYRICMQCMPYTVSISFQVLADTKNAEATDKDWNHLMVQKLFLLCGKWLILKRHYLEYDDENSFTVNVVNFLI